MSTAEFVIGPPPALGVKIDAKGNWGANLTAGGLPTTSTDGFLQIPTMSGPPTGVGTNFVGAAAMVFDSTNNKLWVNLGGATPRWVSVTLA